MFSAGPCQVYYTRATMRCMTPDGIARLVRIEARHVDSSWIGREMIVDDSICGTLSDVARDGRAVVLYVGGHALTVAPRTPVIYDTLGDR